MVVVAALFDDNHYDDVGNDAENKQGKHLASQGLS
jgi:hypothetical protein